MCFSWQDIHAKGCCVLLINCYLIIMKYLTLVILFALEYKYSDSFLMLIVCIYIFSHSFIFNLFITAFQFSAILCSVLSTQPGVLHFNSWTNCLELAQVPQLKRKVPSKTALLQVEYWISILLGYKFGMSPDPHPHFSFNDFIEQVKEITKSSVLRLLFYYKDTTQEQPTGGDRSVQFSCSFVFDSLWHHGLQYTRPPCPSPTPGVYSNSCSLSQWCHPTISSSVVPFSSSFQSFPASRSFQMSQFFASGGQSIGVSASTSVLPMNTQDLFPLGWTAWISLQSKGLSRVFSNTTVQKQ